jgi:RNA polymerase sigma-70 factor (ECF subfamily)
MGLDKDYAELVRQARLGDKHSLEVLAARVRGRLYAYVYRMVLSPDVAEEIVQETMLEMVRVFDKLDEPDNFWAWLRGMAFNKTRRRHTERQRGREVRLSPKSEPEDKKSRDNGLANLVADEIRSIVYAAMSELKPAHRKVLTMRCYEDMDYPEIAKLMGCSELVARVSFFRAKHALAKALSNKGLGKGFVLTALVLFGRMTAPSKAAAAHVSVTAAGTKAGTAATALGLATSKTAIVSVAVAGALAVGTAVLTTGPDNETPTGTGISGRQEWTDSLAATDFAAEQQWYYFPKGGAGPVMMRIMAAGNADQQLYCAYRQNEVGNYYYDAGSNICHIRNRRFLRPDLAVTRLPTDSPQLGRFLDSVEGRQSDIEYVPDRGRALLVVCTPSDNGTGSRTQILRHPHLLEEEYFRYDWPRDIKTVDERDEMRKRGWTYFRIQGQADGRQIRGTARLPFVHAAAGIYSPWLEISIENKPRFADNGTEAVVFDDRGRVIKRYCGGSFFKGLARPWMGLHTLDVLRRDAAEQCIRFETGCYRGEEKAKVTLALQQGRLVYTVDLQADVLDTIVFSANDGRQAELQFDYLQDIAGVHAEFTPPEIRRSYGENPEGPGLLWLLRLFTEN